MSKSTQQIIPTNIPCTLLLPGKNATEACITAVVRGFTGEPFPFRAIINGTSYSLENIWIRDMKLTAYNDDESWYLDEWFRAMEYRHTHNGKTDYQFTEIGLEYCYYPTDFKRHFTCMEG